VGDKKGAKMKKIINCITGTILLAALFLTACGSSSPRREDGSTVLATTTFLADITRNIAGDRLRVESLLPVGADPHAYQPVPADVTKINESKVLIVNGLEYEHFLEGLLENAGGERLIITATDGLEPRQREEHEGEESEDPAHAAGDPHLWLDPNLVMTYVENIREGLTHFDPDGAAVYQSNAAAYVAELKKLDAWIVEQVSQVPEENRLLVTNHEALGYLADRYGFTIIGAVVPSVSTGSSPSAGQMAELIDLIKSSGAPAIFLDEVENAALAQQIAAETGVRVVTDLHLESLTDGAPAATYIDMLKHNVTQIVNALK
jgi:ABC-type Zn uptake system ZnuABC Zn-binding protein ZnuA